MNSRRPGDIELYTETAYIFLEHHSQRALQIKVSVSCTYPVHECIGKTYNVLFKTTGIANVNE